VVGTVFSDRCGGGGEEAVAVVVVAGKELALVDATGQHEPDEERQSEHGDPPSLGAVYAKGSKAAGPSWCPRAGRQRRCSNPWCRTIRACQLMLGRWDCRSISTPTRPQGSRTGCWARLG